MTGQPSADGRFETHDSQRPRVWFNFGDNGSSQPLRISGPALDFDQERHASCDQFEQLGEPRNMFVAVEQPLRREHCGRSRFDRQGGSAKPAKIMIVEQDGLAVT